MKKAFKYLGYTLLGLVAFFVLATTVFLNTSPQFGRAPSKSQAETYAKTGHYEDGIFVNEIKTEMDLEPGRLLKKMFEDAPNRDPGGNFDVIKVDSLDIVTLEDSISRITWFGHSAFLLELEGKKILLDPMLGKSPSPIPWLGPQRYSNELPIAIEDLPYIDAVILSHDHYDHLDYESIQKLKDNVGDFYSPLGVGNHLISWGISEDRVHELSWWDSIQIDSITLVCTPARHFSGRGLFDRSTTMWSSWVISGKNKKVYFSGDGGYGPHFKEIGKKYGPFDLALMECGQYNVDWKAIHMMPEETVQAAIDVKSRYFMPIHWGAFTLAFHDWDDPIVRASAEAQRKAVPIITPRIGQVQIIGDLSTDMPRWWLKY